jgi:hypothetical protein
MTGIGPYTLTHIIYVALVIAFVCVLTGMIAYNISSKRKQRRLVGDNPASKEAGIAAARQAIESKGPNLD